MRAPAQCNRPGIVDRADAICQSRANAVGLAWDELVLQPI
jgi:hypothetical protein